MCYSLLPSVFDRCKSRVPGTSIVLCISPLVALMMDQKEKFTKMGIRAEFISETHHDLNTVQGVKEGTSQLIFISPESLLNNHQWRDVLLTDVYQENLVCVVIDEAHCVPKWGNSFRETYQRVGEIRSLIPSTVRIMALTATASLSTHSKIYRMLGLHPPVLVYMPPVKKNVMYCVKEKEKIQELVANLSMKLISFQEHFPKTIIFCRRFEECSEFYTLFMHHLGPNFTNPAGAPSILSKYRVADMYTSCTQEEVKQNIISSFCSTNGHLRIVIATIAFSMGLDVPDIRHVIHWGPSDDFESYIQETGRAGRDGELCCASLFYAKKDNRSLNKKMIEYCVNQSVCRCKLLFADFEGCDLNTCCKCYCCDICINDCKCSVNTIKYYCFL